MNKPIGYIEEFHKLPYYGDIYLKLVIFNDIYLILKTFVDTNTAFDICFKIGFCIAKLGYYHTIINQTQTKYYKWDDIKNILLSNFDGKYSYFERLTTGCEGDLEYDNMP